MSLKPIGNKDIWSTSKNQLCVFPFKMLSKINHSKIHHS